MREALKETKIESKITWQPLELIVKPVERVDTYHDEVRRAKYQILVEPCKKLGLDMKLPPNIVPRPYIRLAFEGWYFACEHGKGDQYNDLMYLRKALEEGTYSDAERKAVSYTRNELKPTGVPTIYVKGIKVTIADYTKEEMIDILLEQNHNKEKQGFTCCEDGCGASF